MGGRVLKPKGYKKRLFERYDTSRRGLSETLTRYLGLLDDARAAVPSAPPHRPGDPWRKPRVMALVGVFSLHPRTRRRAIAWTYEGLVAAGDRVTIATVRQIVKTARRDGRRAD